MKAGAVFFDLGGTLFRYGDVRAPFDAMLQAVALAAGIDAPPDTVRRAYREGLRRHSAQFLTQSFYLHRDLFGAGQAEMLRQFGIDSAHDPHAVYEGQIQVGLDAVEPREGVRETLEALRGRGLHLGIVSNIDDDQFDPLWARMGLADLFDATTTSEQARSCKPHPAIYHAALAHTDGVAPEEVVFVGDSPPHDVAGARALGMTTVLIGDAARPVPDGQRAHHVIREIPELLAILGAAD